MNAHSSTNGVIMRKTIQLNPSILVHAFLAFGGEGQGSDLVSEFNKAWLEFTI